MSGVDIQAIYAALFARLATDALGSPVRAVLGVTSGVISAEKLRSSDVPIPPFLAFRGGAISGESKEIRILFVTWWVYDQVDQDYWRINGLVPLIETAYPPMSIANGRIVVSTISTGIPDTTLNLLVRPVQLAFYTRG